SPAPDAGYADVPAPVGKAKSYDGWRKDLAAWLFRNRRLDVLSCPRLKAFSRPGETEGDFRARIQHSGHEKRDAAVEALRKKYAPKIAALQEKIRRAELLVERESEQVRQQGLQTAISIGATLIGAGLGRKVISAGSVGRATTAARGAGRVLKERQDVGRAQETVEALRSQLADLDEAFKADAEKLWSSGDLLAQPLETPSGRPFQQNNTVKL